MALIERVISLIAPLHCIQCGLEGALVCAGCLAGIVSPLPSRCYRCYAVTHDSTVCAKCRRTSSLKHVWIVGEYSGQAKRLVHLLKFERTMAAADIMAELLYETLPYFDASTVVVHVPAASSRVRARGYDQSRLIAGALARRLGRPHATLLARHGQARQVGAKRERRLRQLADAFSPRQVYLIKGAHILLIDDVTTTGATLEHAAKALKAAGAHQVDAATFAQKPLV